jgi:hypothetical protein
MYSLLAVFGIALQMHPQDMRNSLLKQTKELG